MSHSKYHQIFYRIMNDNIKKNEQTIILAKRKKSSNCVVITVYYSFPLNRLPFEIYSTIYFGLN